jgi:hypothetical protein
MGKSLEKKDVSKTLIDDEGILPSPLQQLSQVQYRLIGSILSISYLTVRRSEYERTIEIAIRVGNEPVEKKLPSTSSLSFLCRHP